MKNRKEQQKLHKEKDKKVDFQGLKLEELLVISKQQIKI